MKKSRVTVLHCTNSNIQFPLTALLLLSYQKSILSTQSQLRQLCSIIRSTCQLEGSIFLLKRTLINNVYVDAEGRSGHQFHKRLAVTSNDTKEESRPATRPTSIDFQSFRGRSNTLEKFSIDVIRNQSLLDKLVDEIQGEHFESRRLNTHNSTTHKQEARPYRCDRCDRCDMGFELEISLSDIPTTHWEVIMTVISTFVSKKHPQIKILIQTQYGISGEEPQESSDQYCPGSRLCLPHSFIRQPKLDEQITC
nr:hypothetical transcript [Hymenolepis microstoma]